MLNAVKPFIDFYRLASFAPIEPRENGPQRVWRAMRHGWQSAARYRRLASNSDDQLKRLGLDRGSIGRHAFFDDTPKVLD